MLQNVGFIVGEVYGYTLYVCDNKTNEINKKIHTSIIQLKVSWLIDLTFIKNKRYSGADKSLARPTSRCNFLMVIIFRLMLVLLYI